MAIQRARRRWGAVACAAASVAGLTVGLAPATAQDDGGYTPAGHLVQGSVEAEVCDVEVDAKVVNTAHHHGDDFHDHSVSEVIHLDEPLAAGRVLTSGVTTDVDHFDDQVDFTAEASQFEEQVTIRFLNAAGVVIAETDPTPDLPDATPYAPFALPSVDLAEDAVAVQVAHAATGDGFNSINAPCIDFVSVDANSSPSDLVRHSACPTDGPFPLPPEAICGFLAVPEDRDDPHARLINIAFGIMPGDGTKADPLVYLEGGPGGAPMNAAGIIHELAMGPSADGRDVIYVDQRGTGYSQPNLVCFQQELYTQEIDFSQPPPDDYVSSCYERIVDAGVDLAGFTTVENAADVADLRVALGIDEWNLFGGSYGTNLALQIMRAHPEGVRSVILDSVFPPEVNPTRGDDAVGFYDRLDGIVATCAADPDCDSANPDLRNALVRAVDNLQAHPVVVEGTEAEILFGAPALPVDGWTMLSILDFDFSNPNVAAWITGAASDDGAVRAKTTTNFFRSTALFVLGLPPELAEGLTAQYRGVPGPGTEFSDGFLFSVICAEDYPYDTPATSYDGEPWSEAIIAFQELVIQAAFDFHEECGDFTVPAEDPVVTTPVVSDIPSLVLYTDNDFQTPARWSEMAAANLSNSELVFFPNLGHVVTFYDPCPHEINRQFLADPGGPLDTSCTEFLPPISYVPEMTEIDPLPPIEELFALLDELFGPPLDEDGNPIEGPPPGEDGPPPDGEGPPPVGEGPPPEVATLTVATDDSPIGALPHISTR